MMPMTVNEQVPVAPPAYDRAQARLGPALHLDALTLVRTLHLLMLCRLAVRLAPLSEAATEGKRVAASRFAKKNDFT